MAEDKAAEQPVQHQPNVANDPAGQASNVRGVPVHLTGKPADEATGLPKTGEALERQQKQAAELEHAGENDAKKDGHQEG